jgi:hypothetical protein
LFSPLRLCLAKMLSIRILRFRYAGDAQVLRGGEGRKSPVCTVAISPRAATIGQPGRSLIRPLRICNP